VTLTVSVEELAAQLAPLGWSLEAVQLGVRANFCCEYCGADLLATVESYDSWQRDHIVATAKAGVDHLDNLALACKFCNFLKRHTETTKPFELADRREALEVTRKLINERRAVKQERLNQIVRIIEASGARRSGSL
jgi:5-methylcytosine-specific restriction endonuclease McrA